MASRGLVAGDRVVLARALSYEGDSEGSLAIPRDGIGAHGEVVSHEQPAVVVVLWDEGIDDDDIGECACDETCLELASEWNLDTPPSLDREDLETWLNN